MGMIGNISAEYQREIGRVISEQYRRRYGVPLIIDLDPSEWSHIDIPNIVAADARGKLRKDT